VPAALGNGDDPGRNLYWGAAFGVRTFFERSNEWKEIAVTENPSPYVLERAVFLHRTSRTYLVADAYRGREIRAAILGFFQTAAGVKADIGELRPRDGPKSVKLPSTADLVVYVGHDGLMDFTLDKTFHGVGGEKREVMILACASKEFFAPALRPTGAQPVLWTTGLMAPEAYTLKGAIDGWIAQESDEQIRQRAAEAYSKYQKISLTAARRLFTAGW
jgi:hypothetical protein